MKSQIKNRKPISMTFATNSKDIGVVCNDGSMWHMQYVVKPNVGGVYEWVRLPDVPKLDEPYVRMR